MEKRFLAIGIIAIISVIAIGLVIPMVDAARNPRATKACSDGIDNDGDGYTDYPDDPGCSKRNDNSELNPEIECDDGIDNDGDGDTDMDDAGCSGPTDNDETNCGDGVCEGGETSGNCPADCGYPDSCGDTDGGNIITVFGTTSGYLNNLPYSNDDYCVDSSNVMEYYCAGDYEQSQQQSCGTDFYGEPYCSGNDIYKYLTDYFCASGECDSDVTPVFQEDCDSYDGYVGGNYCMNGSVYKDYRDYYCSSGACDYTDTPILQEACIYGCTNATCDPRPDECSDTDRGIEPTIVGTTYGYLNEIFYSNDDYCVDTSNVMEYYCSGDYEQNQQINCGTDGYVGSNYCVTNPENSSVYKDFRNYFCSGGDCESVDIPILQEVCEYGCTAGVCESPPADSCSDTDGGIVEFVFGTVSGYSSGSPYSDDDYCINNATLNEYYCSGTQASSFQTNCADLNASSICVSGACI